MLKKSCSVLNTTFIRGSNIYKCFNSSWKMEKNDCVSEQINNLLLMAEVTCLEGQSLPLNSMVLSVLLV